MAVTASQLLADPERHLPSIKLLLELARDSDAQVMVCSSGCWVMLACKNPCKNPFHILLRLDAVREAHPRCGF